MLITNVKKYWLFYLLLLICLLAGAYYLPIPEDYGLSEEEKIAGINSGRKIFYTRCSGCHTGEAEAISFEEIKNGYSSRELRNILNAPPKRMPKFEGDENDKKDLILFLQEE